MNSHDRVPLRLSWRKKICFAALTTLGFFVAVESLLRVIGFSATENPKDPFVGFSSYLPLLEKHESENGQVILKTAANKLTWFNRIEFPQKKGANSYRIFCLGESTTYGHPYWDVTSYCRWLREFLPIIDREKKWEVINAAGISYASYRIANVMEELTEYEPDLFIVFSAHNEFLERRTYSALVDKPRSVLDLAGLLSKTRTWGLVNKTLQRATEVGDSSTSNSGNDSVGNTSSGSPSGSRTILSAEVDEMLNHTIGPTDYSRDREWRAGVLRHFRSNLERMIAIARKVDCPIAFVAPASNMKDCSPFKSAVDPEASEDRQSEAMTYFQTGLEAEKNIDFVRALDAYDACLAIDPDYADANYRSAKLLFETGAFDLARSLFQKAIDTDVCPLRATGEIVNTIRDVAKTQRVPLIDFESRMKHLCQNEAGHECFGKEYFLDHVHPSIDIHRRLGIWIIEDLQKAKVLGGVPIADASHSDELAAIRDRVDAEFDFIMQGVGLKNLAKTMHWAGRYEESAISAEDALKYLIDDAECRFVMADSLKNLGEDARALVTYEELMDKFPDYNRAFQPYGELLAKHGNWKLAKLYLLLAHVPDPENVSILYWLGMSHLELKEYDLAVEAFERVNAAIPNEPGTLFCLAQALGASGKVDLAIKHLDTLIANGYDRPEVKATRDDYVERSKEKSR